MRTFVSMFLKHSRIKFYWLRCFCMHSRIEKRGYKMHAYRPLFHRKGISLRQIPSGQKPPWTYPWTEPPRQRPPWAETPTLDREPPSPGQNNGHLWKYYLAPNFVITLCSQMQDYLLIGLFSSGQHETDVWYNLLFTLCRNICKICPDQGPR